MSKQAVPVESFVRSAGFIQLVAWALGLLVCGLGLVAWGTGYDWHFWPLNAYILFPLLGVLAFSLMLTHYVLGMLTSVGKYPDKSLASYFRWTGYAVLVCICLHPGLLIYQRFRDGYGLPPGSYEHYVAPGLGWVTLLGTASLLVFLAFEFHRIYEHKPWWHYVADASDPAMLAILYHGIRLGGQLQHGWYRIVWYIYAIVFIGVLIHKYTKRFQTSKSVPGK